jgi:hypothetical protein
MSETITQYRTKRIGAIGQYDGWDEYLLVCDPDDDLDIDAVEDHFLSLHYRDTDIPGGYFCHSVTVSELPSGNECIVIVHHRYDI